MAEDLITTKRLRDALPVFTALASVLFAIAIAAALYFGREVFVPVALAILLSFVLAPLVSALHKVRVPRGLAVLSVVVIAFVVLFVLGGVVAGQIRQLAAELPKYRSTIQTKITSLRGATTETGTFGRAIDMLQDLSREFQQSGLDTSQGDQTSDRLPANSVPNQPIPVEIRDSDAGPWHAVSSVVAPLLHPLATIGLILIFSVFILIQRQDLRNRFIRLVGADDLQKTTAALDDAADRLSRLFLTQIALNSGFGLVIGTGLGLIGIPSPVLWGILAAILRFVPYIGAMISAAIPLTLAVAVDPGWSMFFWSAALFLVLEPILGQVVEPLLYGHSTGLSPIAVILSATFWTFLWGPIGLVLATPLTVCLVVLGRHVERLKFFEVLLSDRPALSPPQIFYQRMLAGDPTEATEQAAEFLKKRALSTYYDEVALQGLRLAQEDIAHGTLNAARLATIQHAIRELVSNLSAASSVASRKGGILGAEAAAAVEAAGPDRAVASVIRGPEHMHPDWRGVTQILCVSGQGILDEGVAMMLGQLFEGHGLRTRVVGPEVLAPDHDAQLGDLGVLLICFSYFEPLSTVHIRYGARRLRRKLPGARVMVGLWRERDPATLEALRRATSADVLVTSLHDALAAAIAMSNEPAKRDERLSDRRILAAGPA